jgi:hypothetical protein
MERQAPTVQLKLEAAEEPRRRPSERRSDAADVSRLLEEHPDTPGPRRVVVDT